MKKKPAIIADDGRVTDQTALDTERRKNIWIRYGKGQSITRDDKKFAGIDSKPKPEDGKVRNYKAVAEYIRQHHGFTCSTMTISRWTNGRDLPPGCLEPFPQCGPDNMHSIAAFMPWVNTHLPKPTDAIKSGEFKDYRSAKEELDYKRAAEEFAHWQKETSGMYVLTTEAVAGAIGALQKLRGFFRTAADRKFGAATVAELRARGFTEEQLAVVGEVCTQVGRDIVREVEAEAAKAETTVEENQK